MLIQKSKEIENGYVLVHEEAGIVIRFIAHRFNETQKVDSIDTEHNPDAPAIAEAMREAGEWLVENYPELAFPATEDSQKEMCREMRKRTGEVIRSARTDQGLTIRAFSELTGVDKSQICRIEAGRLNAGIDTITRLTDSLGISISFTRDSDKLQSIKTTAMTSDHEYTYFFAKNSRQLYLVRENEDGSLFITADGEHSISNAGLFIKNIGGIEALKAKCFRDSRTLSEIREDMAEQRRAARQASKEIGQVMQDERREKARTDLDRLIAQSGGVIETTEDTLRIVARYLASENHGLWRLPEMTIGYAASQYESGAIAIKLDRPIEIDGKECDSIAFGASARELTGYLHLRF